MKAPGGSSSAAGPRTGRTSATRLESRRPPMATPTSPPAPSPAGAPPAPGSTRSLAVPSRPLRARVGVTLWSPDGIGDGVALPLLAVHDGPAYEAEAGLTAVAAGLVDSGRVCAHRIALLHPGRRDEWY